MSSGRTMLITEKNSGSSLMFDLVNWFLIAYVCFDVIQGCYGQFMFPEDLSGTWTVTGQNEFVFQRSALSGYAICPITAYSCKNYPSTWELVLSQRNTYVLRSIAFDQDEDPTIKVQLYTCLYLKNVSAGMYLAFQSPRIRNSDYNDYVLEVTVNKEINLSSVCNFLEKTLPAARNFLLIRKDIRYVKKLNPHMCADNIMGSFSGHDDENLCWVKVDSCAEQGKLLVGSNCTEGIFSTLTNQNADKLICLYSQSEADIERLNVLYNTDQLIYLSSLSLYYMNENKEELIIKVFKKEKLSLDANKVLVYQLKRLNKCKPSCELPSELNGLWYGNRHSSVSIKNDVFIANRIVEEDCNSTEPCSNLDKSRAMRCIYQSDYNFLLRTEHTVVDLVPYAIYSCFYFSHISPNKLVFIFNQRDIDPILKVYAKLMFAKPIIKSAEALCMVNGAYLPVHVNVLIRQGSQHKISEACPKVILKGYKYQMGSCKFVLKFRADDNLFEVVTDCTGGKDDLPFFSVTKKVICVHSSGESKDNGTNFVFLYNDNVPRGPYTYRFVCILYSIQEDTINMTAIPFLCSDTETEFKMQTIFGKAIGDTELEDVLKELGSAEELTTTVSITYLVITALVLNSFLAMYMYRKGRKAEPDEDTSDDEDGEDDDYNMRDSVMISSTDLNG